MFAQIIAICIFVTMFLLIILDKFERHYITLGSGALVLVLVFGVCMRSMSAIWETLNLGAFFQSTFWYGASEESTAGINWSTILFIAGMMIMVEGLGKAGFFRWLCLTLAKLVHYRTVPLLICFMSLSAFLSMFIDSITVVLFLATVTLELAQTMKFDPVPMILSEIFCANLGGAATMCGDPPNIIIGTSLGYTFFDFIENTGAVVAICFVSCSFTSRSASARNLSAPSMPTAAPSPVPSLRRPSRTRRHFLRAQAFSCWRSCCSSRTRRRNFPSRASA